MTDPAVIVDARGITIEFPGVKALDDVDLSLRAGEIHALMGENGAGKSTMIKALTGVYAVDAGTISVGGIERRFGGTDDAQSAGIATVYQEVNLCTNLSVGENVMLGHEIRGRFGIDWRATHAAAAEALRRLELEIDPRSPLSSHSIAVQQLVAISRAMVIRSTVLVLDEPTSSLDRDEVERLFAVMRALRDNGVAILFVSHFLDQIYEICDRVTVLRNGRTEGEYRVAELPQVELVAKMLGRELADLDSIAERTAHTARPDEQTAPVMQVLALGRKGALEPVDLELYEGEVVGLAGLLGSGRTELARLLYGADHADTGRTRIRGSAVRVSNPRAAVDNRIAFSSEDRRSEGIIGDLTVRENMILGLQARRGWARRVPRAQQDRLVATYMQSMDIRPADPETLIRNLSGGNQQKVLLARWLAMAPQVLILDEPTRGIDVGAKAEIQRLISQLAADGLSVVFISSELEEVVRLSHRICVMRDHAKVAELHNGEGVDVDDLVSLIAQKGQVS
ncbi:MAG TPA: sugar ABC transporter ATP-binding protein [Humibacter sp.]|nr:sugar ABC transporter ATP-binding protein [Humibacter sp.]